MKVDHREIKYPDFRCVDIDLSYALGKLKEKKKKDLSKVDHREIKYPDFRYINIDLSLALGKLKEKGKKKLFRMWTTGRSNIPTSGVLMLTLAKGLASSKRRARRISRRWTTGRSSAGIWT